MSLELGGGVGALSGYNDHAASGDDPRSFANPSPETCRFCPFRVACRPFFEAVSDEWGWFHVSFVGEIIGVTHGRRSTRVDVASTDGSARGDVGLLNIPLGAACSAGQTLATVDAVPSHAVGDVRMTSDTALALWESRPPAEASSQASGRPL